MKIKKIKRYEKEELRYRRKEDRRQENERMEDMRMREWTREYISTTQKQWD